MTDRSGDSDTFKEERERMTRFPFAFRVNPLRTMLTALFIACILIPCPIGAQDLKRLEPLPVPPQVEAPGPPLKPPSAPALPGKDERLLVEALRAVVFLDRTDAVAKKAELPPDALDVRRLPRLQTPEFRKVVEPYLGKPVSMAALNRLVGSVQAYYNKMDLPFVSVTLPEQDITTGVVQLLVVEAKLGAVRVEGARWFSDKLYLSSLRTRPGDPLKLSILNDDIAWINKNPFRQANFFFDKGEQVGGTNLVLRTQERLPLRVYAGYNNYGSETTDRNQFLGGFNWGNAFGLGHLLNYQFTMSPDFQQQRGHSGSYAIPLPWRDTLTISGSYSEIEPKMEEPFDRNGMSGSVAIRYDKDLPSFGLLRHILGLMPEYKVTDNNLLFGGTPVTDNRTEILQVSLIYSGDIPDNWGANTFGFKLTGSPGGLSKRNKTKYFELTRADAKADYYYATFDLARTQRLPFDFSLLLSGHAQLASGNLLGSEQLGLGGVNSVRGFDEGIVYGDQGYLLRAELHTPALPLERLIPFSGAPRIPLDMLAFYDYGTVGNVDLLPEERRWNTLKSAGVGFRLAVDRHIALSFDYGWRLTDYAGVDYNSRGHISVTVSY